MTVSSGSRNAFLSGRFDGLGYSSNDMQIVTAEDAAGLADALERALEEMPFPDFRFAFCALCAFLFRFRLSDQTDMIVGLPDSALVAYARSTFDQSDGAESQAVCGDCHGAGQARVWRYCAGDEAGSVD